MLLQPHLGDTWKLYSWRERSFVLEQLVTNMPERWLPQQYTNWNDFLTAALERGLKEKHAPSNLASWKWGHVNKLEIDHPVLGSTWFARALVGMHTGTGEWPIIGNGFTVRPGLATHGASERFTVDPADPENATLVIPIGQSSNPASEWYIDQFPAWLKGTTFTLPFSTQHTTHTLVLSPQ